MTSSIMHQQLLYLVSLMDSYHSSLAITVQFVPYYYSASMILLSLFSCNASGEDISTTENYKHFSILLLWGQLLSLSNERGFM